MNYETKALESDQIREISYQRHVEDLRRKNRVDLSLREVKQEMLVRSPKVCECGIGEHNMVSFVLGGIRRTMCPYLLAAGWMRLNLNGMQVEFKMRELIELAKGER